MGSSIEASAPGQTVTLVIQASGGEVVCSVEDEGPGLPTSVQDTLFIPCRSTKTGGSGLGLAISKQLAQHIGATLALQHSSASGCLFTLTLPGKIFLSSPAIPGREMAAGSAS